MLKKIEILVDTRRYSDSILIPIKTWEEAEELYNDGETIACYEGGDYFGEVYSRDFTDEHNPSQYEFKEQVWDANEDEVQEIIKKLIEANKKWCEAHNEEFDEDDFDERDEVYASDEFYDLCKKYMEDENIFMVEGHDWGGFGRERGIGAVSFNNDNAWYRVVAFSDIEADELIYGK